MTALFDGLLAVADQAVDAVNGEPFDFTPMRAVKNGSPVSDTARDSQTGIIGVFSEEGTLSATGIGNSMERLGAEFETARPLLSIRTEYLPQGVRQFDRFTRSLSGLVYEVRRVQPDGLGRLLIVLTEI